MVQTSMPDHPIIAALRSGRPLDFLQNELSARARDGFPPAGELLALDLREPPAEADAQLRDVAGAEVLGPADTGEGQRWLLQGKDLGDARVRLRGLVQSWRDAGVRVRIDVDPSDL